MVVSFLMRCCCYHYCPACVVRCLLRCVSVCLLYAACTSLCVSCCAVSVVRFVLALRLLFVRSCVLCVVSCLFVFACGLLIVVYWLLFSAH